MSKRHQNIRTIEWNVSVITSMDCQTVDDKRLMLHTICLDNGHIMAIDGKRESVSYVTGAEAAQLPEHSRREAACGNEP